MKISGKKKNIYITFILFTDTSHPALGRKKSPAAIKIRQTRSMKKLLFDEPTSSHKSLSNENPKISVTTPGEKLTPHRPRFMPQTSPITPNTPIPQRSSHQPRYLPQTSPITPNTPIPSTHRARYLPQTSPITPHSPQQQRIPRRISFETSLNPEVKSKKRKLCF